MIDLADGFNLEAGTQIALRFLLSLTVLTCVVGVSAILLSTGRKKKGNDRADH